MYSKAFVWKCSWKKYQTHIYIKNEICKASLVPSLLFLLYTDINIIIGISTYASKILCNCLNVETNEIIILFKKKKTKTTFRPNVMHYIDIINVDIN